MKKIMVILATLLLLLALSSISQAVTFSLISGGFQTSADASQNNDYIPPLPPGLTWQYVSNSDNGQYSSNSSAILGDGYADAESGAGGGFSSYTLTNEIYVYPNSPVPGYSNHIDAGASASSSFFFQVLGPDTNSIGNGSILFSWSLTGNWFTNDRLNTLGGLGIHSSPLTVTVNGVTVVPTNYLIYWPLTLDGIMTGSVEVDVAIGDIIEFSSSLNNYVPNSLPDDTDLWASLSVDLTAGDFIYGQVPLPSTVLLLGSGLLGLAGWRRFRKS